MAALRVLMVAPDRDQVDAVRAALQRQGFGAVTFGDIRKRTKGQLFEDDVLVIGTAPDGLAADCFGRCVVIEALDELERVEPDKTGRPVLVEPAPDDLPPRRELFARAREAGAKVRVNMGNRELAEAVYAAEAEQAKAEQAKAEAAEKTKRLAKSWVD